jgi:hypothetical protein
MPIIRIKQERIMQVLCEKDGHVTAVDGLDTLLAPSEELRLVLEYGIADNQWESTGLRDVVSSFSARAREEALYNLLLVGHRPDNLSAELVQVLREGSEWEANNALAALTRLAYNDQNPASIDGIREAGNHPNQIISVGARTYLSVLENSSPAGGRNVIVPKGVELLFGEEPLPSMEWCDYAVDSLAFVDASDRRQRTTQVVDAGQSDQRIADFARRFYTFNLEQNSEAWIRLNALHACNIIYSSSYAQWAANAMITAFDQQNPIIKVESAILVELNCLMSQSQ